MGGVDTGRRDEAAPRGGDAEGELLPVARRDGAGGEGRRVEGARGRPGDGDPPLPQGRPPRARRRRRHTVRGAHLLPARAARDGGERPPLVLDVRACRRVLRATQRPEPRDGQLPEGAGVRPRRRALAPLLPGARGGGAGAAVGRPSGEFEEERRGDRPLRGSGGGAEGGRGGDPVPPVGEGGAGGRDARPDGGAALLPADSKVLRGRAQLRRRRAVLPPRRAAAGRRRDVLEGKQVGYASGRVSNRAPHTHAAPHLSPLTLLLLPLPQSARTASLPNTCPRRRWRCSTSPRPTASRAAAS